MLGDTALLELRGTNEQKGENVPIASYAAAIQCTCEQQQNVLYSCTYLAARGVLLRACVANADIRGERIALQTRDATLVLERARC